jgi:hypothetical protein
METIRKHINALRYAFRVARMTYRRELMHNTPDVPELDF